MTVTATTTYSKNFFTSGQYQSQIAYDAYLEFAYNLQRIPRHNILASKLSMLSPTFQDLFNRLAFQLAITMDDFGASNIVFNFTKTYVDGHTKCCKLTFHIVSNNSDHRTESVAAGVELRQADGSLTPEGIFALAQDSTLDVLLTTNDVQFMINQVDEPQASFNLCARIEEILDTAPLVAISRLPNLIL